MRIYFVAGIIALVINVILDFCELPETFWIGFAKGSSTGLAFAAMILGLLYTSGYMTKLIAAKKFLISSK